MQQIIEKRLIFKGGINLNFNEKYSNKYNNISYYSGDVIIKRFYKGHGHYALLNMSELTELDKKRYAHQL